MGKCFNLYNWANFPGSKTTFFQFHCQVFFRIEYETNFMYFFVEIICLDGIWLDVSHSVSFPPIDSQLYVQNSTFCCFCSLFFLFVSTGHKYLNFSWYNESHKNLEGESYLYTIFFGKSIWALSLKHILWKINLAISLFEWKFWNLLDGNFFTHCKLLWSIFVLCCRCWKRTLSWLFCL